MFPSKDKLTICFAHVAYGMQDRFVLRKTGIKSFQVKSYEDFEKRVGEADVVVASGMWKNDVIPLAKNLKFIQSISAGMDQYSKEQLGAKAVLIVGTGKIGGHLAMLCKAFGMKVIGIRRDPAKGANGADSIHGM